MVEIQCPATAQRDEQTPLVVTDLPAGTRTTLIARTDGFYGGASSRQVFDSGPERTVDTGSDIPIDGDYEGVAPMGWLWSMTPERDDQTSSAIHDEPVTIELSVQVEGETHATATTIRQPGGAGVHLQSIESSTVAGEFAYPSSGDPCPGVLVLHGSDGKPMTGVARLLASHGFAALALRWLGDGAPTDVPTDVPLSYIDDAAAWLKGHEVVDSDSLGIWGISKGGELAFAAAAYGDWVDAVVAVSPSGLIMPGERPGSATIAIDGESLPSLSIPDGPPPENGLEMTHDLLDASDNETLEAATIPVDDTDAPLLVLAGREDTVWDAVALTDETMDRLASADTSFPANRVVYDDAGHSLRPPYVPHTVGTAGGTTVGKATAAVDAWDRTLSTLGQLSNR
ncbi:acyl-CoA thioester hydrolase/BAAT C-terminal domain-containing protein [Halovenus rubra]|uniref:Acyl-CoA thioester hydrolase/BAAT C-terminal domain-containing protein n=2 Tax=Halovenus rubra TaxID=869890 RepID=A0ABD5X5G7_9EURY|nr:acyl-CoA thioester hydrolase/BAAT C-terminal domain-containing protein [Halovenus rubra]